MRYFPVDSAMKMILFLTVTLLLAGCASNDEDYSSQSGSSPVHLAKPGGEPGLAMKQTF